jgi:hypothetical protein
MKKSLNIHQYNLLAVHRLFNYNDSDHYLEWTSADETKPYGTEFYLVPVTTSDEAKKSTHYFKKWGKEVTMETLEQTVIN